MTIDNFPYKVILASNSPRRKELLGGLGLPFETRVLQGIDESWPETLHGEEIPLHISRLKASAYKSSMKADELIITADTIVCIDGQVLGKPHDKADATRMLTQLSGRWHEVITGVTLTSLQQSRSFAVTTRVKFAELSPEEIGHYVESGLPLDKAGAYGIQEWIGFVGIEGIEGSYFNVVGLPVQRLYRELLTFGELRS